VLWYFSGIKIDILIHLYINWNMDPEIFRVGNLAIRWYGLLFAASFYLGYLIMMRIFKRDGVAVEAADKLVIYIIAEKAASEKWIHISAKDVLGQGLFFQR